MEVIKGNLIELAKEGHFDIIVHGCNCFCVMGAGIASQIAEEFPKVAEVDNYTIAGDYNKLGNYSCEIVQTESLTHTQGQSMMVVNAYTQFRPGKDARYNAIEMVFEKLNHNFAGNTVGIPFIGCGIGGLHWRKVKNIIDRVTPDLTIVAVKYQK